MNRTGFILGISLCSVVALAESPPPPAAVSGKARLLMQLTTSMAGKLQEFQLQTEGLLLESQTFCERPSPARLTQVKTAWLHAMQQWAGIESVAFGPLIERRSARQLNAWPVRPKLLEPLLASKTPLTEAQTSGLGLSARGLPAVEWLLYPTPSIKVSAYNGRRCELLQALSQQLVQEAQALNQAWPGFAAGWGKAVEVSRSEAEQTALSDWLNLIIASVDQLKARKLNKLLAAREQGEVREHLEAWRSQQSLNLLKLNLASLEQALATAPDALLPYLQVNRLPIAAEELQNQLNALRQAQQPLTGSLPVRVAKQPAQVQALQQQVQALQILLEHRVAEALGVDLGFNVSDGD